jgi:hypothetical protein
MPAIPQTNPALDLSNEFMLGTIAGDNRIVIANAPKEPVMDADRWLVFAAWIVRVAQPHTKNTFETIRTAVANS